MNPGGTMTALEHLVLLDSLECACHKNLAPDIYAEVGTWEAVTSEQIAAYLSHQGEPMTYIGVDINPEAESFWKQKVSPWSQNSELRTEFFTGDSRELHNKISELSWVLIDGCHCFECVTDDIRNWASKVVVGGHAVFHDSTPRRVELRKTSQHNRTRRFGVYQAITASKLLKTQFKHIIHVDEIKANGLDVFERVR
jgi:hypothetical protein